MCADRVSFGLGYRERYFIDQLKNEFIWVGVTVYPFYKWITFFMRSEQNLLYKMNFYQYVISYMWCVCVNRKTAQLIYDMTPYFSP
jgi:hypothetical protein